MYLPCQIACLHNQPYMAILGEPSRISCLQNTKCVFGKYEKIKLTQKNVIKYWMNEFFMWPQFYWTIYWALVKKVCPDLMKKTCEKLITSSLSGTIFHERITKPIAGFCTYCVWYLHLEWCAICRGTRLQSRNLLTGIALQQSQVEFRNGS